MVDIDVLEALTGLVGREGLQPLTMDDIEDYLIERGCSGEVTRQEIYSALREAGFVSRQIYVDTGEEKKERVRRWVYGSALTPMQRKAAVRKVIIRMTEGYTEIDFKGLVEEMKAQALTMDDYNRIFFNDDGTRRTYMGWLVVIDKETKDKTYKKVAVKE